MKKTLSLMLIIVITLSSIAFGYEDEKIDLNEKFKTDSKENIVFNNNFYYSGGMNISVNGTRIFDANPCLISEYPTTIISNRDNYYFSKKVLEEIGLKTYWNGTDNNVEITLNDKTIELQVNGNISMLPKENISYKNKITINTPFAEIEDAYILNDKGIKVKGLDIKGLYKKIVIRDTYYLSLGKQYTLVIIKDDNIIKKEITINKVISLESFEEIDAYPLNFKYIIMPMDEKKGFSHPYIIYFPTKDNNSIEKDFNNTLNTLLVDTDNSGTTPRNDFQYILAMSHSGFRNSIATDISAKYYKKYNKSYIGVFTIFPRLQNNLYTHALDRETVFNSQAKMDSYDRGNLYRIDIQHDNMIINAQEVLKGLGKTVDDQVVLTGFSASADFATRFNYLHPDRAKAIIVNDSPTLPLTEYKGETLRFPLGMGDIQEVTGEKFDLSKFLDTPQFWTTGKNDTNDGTYMVDGWGDYGDYKNNWNQEGIDYRRLFGSEIRQRKETIKKVLKEEGIDNIEAHVYPIAHGVSEQGYNDMIEFLRKHNIGTSSNLSLNNNTEKKIEEDEVPTSIVFEVGEKIGDVLYTDIKTYLNNIEVESFNINGSTAIYASDIKKLGYDVQWDSEKRLVNLTKNNSMVINENKEINTYNNTDFKIGDKIENVLYTDILTKLNGELIESFNINGSTAIYASSLKKFGLEVKWDENLRKVLIAN